MKKKNKFYEYAYFYFSLILAIVYSTFGHEITPSNIDIRAGFISFLFTRYLLLLICFAVFIKAFYKVQTYSLKIDYNKFAGFILQTGLFAVFQITIVLTLLIHAAFSSYGVWKLQIDTAENLFKNPKTNSLKLTEEQFQNEINILNRAIKISKDKFDDDEITNYTIQVKNNFEKNINLIPSSK